MWRNLTGWVRRLIAAPFSLYLILLVLISLLLCFELGSKPARLSSRELTVAKQSQSIGQIQNNPINAPYKLVVFTIKKAHTSDKTAVRLSSVLFGTLFALSFYWLAKAWFGRFIGLLGMIILLTTPLFFILARSGTGQITLFSIIWSMSAYTWFIRSQSHKTAALSALVLSSVLIIYAPGAIWWLIGSVIVCRRKLMESFSSVSVTAVGMIMLAGLVFLGPLIWGLSKETALAKDLLLIPVGFPGVSEVLKNLGWMVSALFVKTQFQNGVLLGRLPVLNIIETSLLAFGAYALWSSARKKTIILIAAVLYAVIGAAINNNLTLIIIGLPALCIFVTAGLRYLFIEWRSVFPLNPVAKILSLTLLSAVVAVNMLYGLKYTLNAWPHSVTSNKVRVLK